MVTSIKGQVYGSTEKKMIDVLPIKLEISNIVLEINNTS